MNPSGKNLDAQADAIFDRALDLPAAERDRFVAAECGDDAALRAKVERLLAWSADPSTRLEASPPVGALWLEDDEGETDGAGLPSRVGPFRLVREIGRGGMGVVYLAERADGHFRQQVAVKVMRPGSDTREARRRFEQERQIIASLQHTAIARLYDGGVTEDGRPFSAMEYVEGRPIDVYCDEERLSLADRLRLLEVVGGAVHYAHQNLVVHRDLKPSNILVTDQGEVKLLDFGIAKLLDATVGDLGLLTRTGGMPVTPLYASPEQLLGEPITTASDIYQLGLLLFELLSGERARDLGTGSSSKLSTARTPVFQTAPTATPSSTVRRMPPERAVTVALSRRTTPKALIGALRDEVDLIVQAAMRPDAERRYPSAAELVEDLRRHRRGEALSVRADSLATRLRGFLRRNRLSVSIATGFVLLLVAYSVTVTVQARKISRERDRAQRIQAFALGLYGAGDPNEALGPELSAADLVARGVARADAELAEDPDVQAEIKSYFGNVYLRLGMYAEAEPLYREVLALRRELRGDVDAMVAAAEDDLGRLLLERDDPEALELLEDALSRRRRILGDRHHDTARSLVNLGRYQRSVRHLAEAEQLMDEGLDIFCAEDPRGADCADTLAELGWVLNLSDRFEEAERLLRRNLEINLHLFGEVHPEVATAWNNLGNTLWNLERWKDGDEAMARSLEVMAKLYGESHPDIASSLGNQAGSLQRRGDLDGAIELFEKARDMRIAILGPRHVRVAEITAQLAEAFSEAGRFSEAEPLFEESLSIFQEHLPADHPSFARLWRGLGSLRLDAGDLAGAKQALETSRAIYAGLEGSKWPWRVDVLLAEIDRKQGHADEAAARLDAAEEQLRDDDEWLGRIRVERASASG